MSTPNNTGYIDGVFTRNYPNKAANDINSGDLVYVDQTSYDVMALIRLRLEHTRTNRPLTAE
jgi:hypothetical protein